MARHEKVAHAIKREVSSIIHDELKDPRLGFVTITGVTLTCDLQHAKIFFSVLGQDQEYARTADALDSALGFIRRLIGQRIKLRYVPQVSFHEDRAGEYSMRIEEILEEIKKEDEPAHSNRGRKKK